MISLKTVPSSRQTCARLADRVQDEEAVDKFLGFFERNRIGQGTNRQGALMRSRGSTRIVDLFDEE